MRGESLELPVFVVCSAVIAILSRRSLRERHSYGYYRFFAFEFTLLLVITNLRVWFDDPFSPVHVLSWLSLLASLGLVTAGFVRIGLERAMGKGNSDRLVESGIYARIRHPLYSSLLFLALGAFLKLPSLFSALVMVGAIFTLVTTARAEEAVNEEKFGSPYTEYIRRTKMFIPFLF
jgi:protein-S-isoprenylcysteine O-methyltransferase Ste14